ncbi:MAG: RDD family protein, partial [Bacilli bacterium]|nr:RDD family protein [Bacilli bacterium]
IITIVVYMIYFGVLPFIMHGQTPAKKLLHLKVVGTIKVVNDKDEEKNLPLWKYLVRAFLICETIFTIANLIMINVMPKNAFINASFWVKELQFIYELAFLICIVLREDQRSIHDLLLGTCIIFVDKEGNRIPDLVNTTDAKEVEEVKENKEINSPKKKSTSKNNSKKKNTKKEEVKAEKVDD